MVRCPKCKAEIASPIKTWPVLARKSLQKGETSRMIMGIFECPKCEIRFRAILETGTKTEETASIKNMIARIRGIKGELMQTLKNLREKIKTLETERANLMIEIENLKKVAESRADTLESEINMLREEVSSLRDLLGYVEEPGK
ncbi:hypothetical protein HXY33_05085 [Candidatus Bathyarchaeota archaeon]|nr:hypothetical protein [Candidatus Bathyarchaeota archaeon]